LEFRRAWEPAEPVEEPLDEVRLRLREWRVEPDAPRSQTMPSGRFEDVAPGGACEVRVVEDDVACACGESVVFSLRYPRSAYSAATRDFPAPGSPMTSTTSPRATRFAERRGVGRIRSRSCSVSSREAALTAERTAAGRLAPGMATTFGPRPSSQASATSASVASCPRATSPKAS
jgi:hypothetical protein